MIFHNFILFSLIGMKSLKMNGTWSFSIDIDSVSLWKILDRVYLQTSLLLLDIYWILLICNRTGAPGGTGYAYPSRVSPFLC